MPPSRTAVIVGAGVIGLSTAYHLAKKKYGKIVVLDKGLAGDGSSSRAAGIITCLQLGETSVRARQKALALYRELSSELEGYRFKDVGCLNLFNPASWPEREALLPLYRNCQVAFEILSSREISRRWPGLTPGEELIGLFDPLGGYSEPEEYIPALVQKCRALGVEILEQQLVDGFLRRGERVTGVRTNVAEFSGDAVIATVYSWNHRLLSTLGLRLPVKAFVHQRYVTRLMPDPPPLPAVNADFILSYIRPARGGRLLLGIATPDREEFHVPALDWHMSAVTPPRGQSEAVMEHFKPIVPALSQANWETEKVGLLTYSIDGDPILGPVGRLPGLYLGLAFHSGGFAYNPVAGMLLAEYVAEGGTSIDVSPFSPDRFDAKETEAYLARTIRQKDLPKRRH